MQRRHINSGAPAELLVAQKAIQQGYVVSFPFSGKASYDLVIDNWTRLVKVQVKTIYKGKTDNGIRWMMDFSKPKGMTFKYEKYKEKDCDYIISACPEYQACYIFPIEFVKDKRQASFYFDEKPHNNARNYDWVDEFKEAWF